MAPKLHKKLDFECW